MRKPLVGHKSTLQRGFLKGTARFLKGNKRSQFSTVLLHTSKNIPSPCRTAAQLSSPTQGWELQHDSICGTAGAGGKHSISPALLISKSITSPNPTQMYSYSEGAKTRLYVGEIYAEPCLLQQELCCKGEEISLPWDVIQQWKMESLSLVWGGAPLKNLYQFFCHEL